jgi:hypothetical protein
LRIRAIVGQTKNAKVWSLNSFVFSPIQTRTDDRGLADERTIHPCAHFNNFTCPVRAENDRQLNPGILATSDEDITMIDRSGFQSDQNFIRVWLVLCNILNAKILRTAQLT